MAKKSDVSRAAALMGRRGGRSRSDDKIAAVMRNLKKARAKRWTKKGDQR